MTLTVFLVALVGFTCALFLTCVYSFTLIYFFQTKEYRFDRVKSFLKESGVRTILLPSKIYKPKKSIRNILILAFTIGWFFILTVITDTAFCWPVVFLAVPLAVVITEPLATIKRVYEVTKAKSKLEKIKPTVIGITGSYGKTSTKDFLHTILSSQFDTQKTFQNYNTNVGVAISINKSLTSKTKYFIAEIGAYKIGEIKTVTQWVKPAIAILTALGNQHIDLFGSKENLTKAKKELLESLPENGTAYVNCDSDDYQTAIKDLKCNVVLYSIKNQKADIYIKDSNIQYKDKKIKLNTKLLGVHNLLNLLPCIGIAIDLGISDKKIEQVLAQLKNEYGKLSLHTGVKKAQIIFDGKNSNYNGFMAALDVLKTQKADTKFVISKGIIELGTEKQNSYIEILKKLNKVGAKLITTDKLFSDLDKHNTVKFIKTEKELKTYLDQNLDNGTALLVEGRFTDTFIKSLGITNQ